MSLFTKIKIVLTVLIAIVLGILVASYAEQYSTDVNVVVAKVKINERTIVKPEMLEVKPVRARERDMLVPRSVSATADLAGPNIKYVSKIDIPVGKVIDLETDVVRTDGNANITTDEYGNVVEDDKLPAGYLLNPEQRLIALTLDAASSVNFTLSRGDMVDVIGSIEKQTGNTAERITLVLAQRVEVFDIQDMSEAQDLEYQNIVLKLPLKQASNISWVKQYGKIDLILSSINANNQPSQPITQTSILSSYGATN